MNEGRKKFEASFRLTDTQPQQCPTASVSKPKTNRLSRSFRQSQQPPTSADSPKSQHTDFKTPTRIPRSRYVGGFTAESPHNESEFHHDIVWDATSPSPVRAGKRGKKRSANRGVVDIAEIVSRIAPKHGRPEVIEPTLQQWIGDSAALPCTPALQIPKPKKKSPRVDDLLKLAKEFDFNMFRQAEEEAEEIHQQSLELLSEDILDFENGNEDEIPPVPLETSQPAVNAVSGRNSQVNLPLNHHMEDDLDFLFDGPTQHVSGNLSQISIAQSLGAKPAPAPFSQAVSGKDSGPSCGPISCVSTTNTKCNEVDNNFEDDWENDDFLNESLVFEMTQNPQNFATPKHCSTQRGSCETQYQRDSAVNILTSAVARHQPETRQGQSVVSKAEKENVKHRITFKLEANPDFPVKRILTDTSTNSKYVSGHSTCAAGKDAQQSRFSSSKGLSIEIEPQLNWQPHHSNVKSNPQESMFHQRTSVANSRAKYNTCASASSNTSVTKTTKSYPMKTSQSESISNHKPTKHREVSAPPVPQRNNDFQDDDLDFFFLSDSGWDDQEDDDLLCEMCEDLESQVQSRENKQTLPVGHTTNQRPALTPSNRVWDNMNQQTQVKTEQFKHVPTYPQSSSERSGNCVQSFPKNPTSLPSGSGRPAENSFARTYTSNCTVNLKSNSGRESYRHMQANGTSVVKTSTNLRGNEIQSTAALSLGNVAARQSQFTFKRPNNPVTTVTNKVLGKCSAAEIELKKQQAMEKRRQRMQATQNLRAPT